MTKKKLAEYAKRVTRWENSKLLLELESACEAMVVMQYVARGCWGPVAYSAQKEAGDASVIVEVLHEEILRRLGGAS